MPDAVEIGLDPTREVPLLIDVLPRGEYVDGHTADLGSPTKIAGLDTWYLIGNTAGWGVRQGGSTLVVNHGRCQFHFKAKDSGQLPYDELRRMVEGARFADCTDPSTWTRPVR
jgi:hypothetical protein